MNQQAQTAFQAAAALQSLAHERGRHTGRWRTAGGTDLTFDYRRVIESHKKADFSSIEMPKRSIADLICEIQVDLSEAYKGSRSHSMDENNRQRPKLEARLAKAVVNIFDVAGGMQLDLPGAIVDHIIDSEEEKLLKNRIVNIYSKEKLDSEFKRLMKERENAS